MTRMFQCLVLIFWLKLAALIVKCFSASRLGDENIIFFCYFHFLVKDVTMTRMSQCLPPTWKSWKSRPMSLRAGREWSLVRWQKQNIQLLRLNFLITLFAINFFLAWILLPNICPHKIAEKPAAKTNYLLLHWFWTMYRSGTIHVSTTKSKTDWPGTIDFQKKSTTSLLERSGTIQISTTKILS